MAKLCPLITTTEKTQNCVAYCEWYVYYGREKEDRLGTCVMIKLADLLEVHYLEMV